MKKLLKKIKVFIESPLGKVILEAGRWGILAALSKILLLLPQIEQTTNIETLTIILRFIDASLHKSGIAEKGIVRF